jgi:NAD(P)-dependent dehydrogenase (short-subunit alcohol dehydrogenase family)
MSEPLNGKTILITSAARRVGKIFAVACARGGANVVIQYGHSDAESEEVRNQMIGFGRRAWIFRADLNDSSQAADLIPLVAPSTPIHGLVNRAAIFVSLLLQHTSMEDWQKHLAINVTAPFLTYWLHAKQRISTIWIK